MFWKKNNGTNLPGPKDIPELAGRYLVTELKQNPDWVWHLKSVILTDSVNKKKFDVRVYDDGETGNKGIKVKDYTSFDEHPELVLFEGWYDKNTMQAKLEDKRVKVK